LHHYGLGLGRAQAVGEAVPAVVHKPGGVVLRERGQDRVFQSDQMASSGGRGWGKLVFLEPFLKLSVRDKPVRRDETLDTLLYLDAEIIALDEEGAYWVKFEVRRIPETPEKPHGLDYSLTLHGPGSGDDDSRLVGFDNAHQVRGKRRDPSAWDHKHRFKSVRPYDYSDAAALLADFWAAVESVLDERGINR
jgi:Family of unknown function (DUF6516)